MGSEILYRVDRNHFGVRLVVMAVMFMSGVLGLFFVMPLITEAIQLTGLVQVCVSVVGVILIGVGLSWGTEIVLREIWPSGRFLVAGDAGIELRSRRGEPAAVRWEGRVNIMAWYFTIQRGRSLVPKGWYCVACRLTQDETVITPYAFFKPDSAPQLPNWNLFELLVSKKSAPKQGEEHLLRKFAEQNQLRSAEKDRWDNGVEMSAPDFMSLMSQIKAHVPDWSEASTE